MTLPSPTPVSLCSVCVGVCVCVSCVELERVFLPWLTGSTADALHQQVVVRWILDDTIRYVMSTRHALMDELEAQFLMIESGADQDHLVRVGVARTPRTDRQTRQFIGDRAVFMGCYGFKRIPRNYDEKILICPLVDFSTYRFSGRLM